MTGRQSWWPVWAQKLQRLGINEAVATLLETAGPLSNLAAQMLYFGQPLFGSSKPESGWSAAADLLADPQECRTFASFLRKEGELD